MAKNSTDQAISMTKLPGHRPLNIWSAKSKKIKISCHLTFVIHIQWKLYVKDKFCTLLNFNYTLLKVNYMLSNKNCTLLYVNYMLSNNYCTLLKLQVIMRVLYVIEQLLYLSCPAKLYMVY